MELLFGMSYYKIEGSRRLKANPVVVAIHPTQTPPATREEKRQSHPNVS
jgi:hypothetical protein